MHFAALSPGVRRQLKERSFPEGMFELTLERQEGYLCGASGRENSLDDGKEKPAMPGLDLRRISSGPSVECKIGLIIKISIFIEQQNSFFFL